MNVYVVRHAQSRSNVKDPENHPFLPEVALYEANDPSLTALGRKQADRLGQRLSQIDFDYIFTGPRHRHLATAYGIVTHQKNCKTVEIIPGLTETDQETRIGIPLDILNSIFPGMEIIPSPIPQRTGGPVPSDFTDEDKTPDGFLLRARRVIKFLKDNIPDKSNVLLVTSSVFGGGVLMPAMMDINDEDIIGGMPFEFNNASVSLITFKNWECFGDFSSCRFSNDVTHLIVPDEVDVSKLPLPNQYPAFSEAIKLI